MSEIIPLGSWVDHGVKYLLDHDANTFDAIGKVIESFAALIEHGLQSIPMWLMMAIFVGIGLWPVGRGVPLFTLTSFVWFYATLFQDRLGETTALSSAP